MTTFTFPDLRAEMHVGTSSFFHWESGTLIIKTAIHEQAGPAFGGIYPGIPIRAVAASPQPLSLETTIHEVLQEGEHNDPTPGPRPQGMELVLPDPQLLPCTPPSHQCVLNHPHVWLPRRQPWGSWGPSMPTDMGFFLLG